MVILWVGRDKVWVRFWDRDGKGLGADLASFLSSVESRFGEVGTNVVAWGVGYMGWARYSWKLPAIGLWKGGWGYRNGPSSHIDGGGNPSITKIKCKRSILISAEEFLAVGLGWMAGGTISRRPKWTEGWLCFCILGSYNEPIPMARCNLWCSERLMELALNQYYSVWIESHPHHISGKWRNPRRIMIRYQYLPFLYSRDGNTYVVWGYFWGLDKRSETQVGKPEAACFRYSASCNLPSELEVVYPSMIHNHSRVTKLSVSYQWKPPLCSHCVVFGHNLHQCKHKPNPDVEMVSAAISGTPSQNGHISGSDVPIAPTTTTNASAPRFDEDGFTMVSRHKKRGPIKLQSKKQKPIRVKMSSQHVGPGRSTSNIAPNGLGEKKKGGASLAKQQVTHGEAPCVSTNPPARLVPGVGSTKPSIYMGFDSANRFSVLDIPSSIKFSKLVEVQVDLYPPDNGLADSMDLEVNTLNSNGNVDYMSIGKYGISDAQKQVILNCLQDFKYVQVEAVEQWSQGEWDFFADKCMEMGLDPENSIIYPEEDTEIDDVEDIDGFDSAQAVSHLKKLGSYVDPVVTKSPNQTINASRKVDPPDPGVEGKFWETNDSSDDAGEDKEQNQIKGVTSKKSGPRKGKSKPSSLLDGTLESALRRYSLRSDAGGLTAAHQNP
ncbi:hypothetical protein L1987_47742 [Smallanthus sonchifolius]|uniref:Uncharacterized protein n=1 Tax=Smallanthus sonchifolius TaxID=185202 RepID=A0ACB9G2S5_9ASTR|nr:hypothetical protein L1987_47742 [Smallanthus sonchifolius]